MAAKVVNIAPLIPRSTVCSSAGSSSLSCQTCVPPAINHLPNVINGTPSASAQVRTCKVSASTAGPADRCTTRCSRGLPDPTRA
ncbi:hypothetical protein D3C84_893410 [compost metagenome]